MKLLSIMSQYLFIMGIMIFIQFNVVHGVLKNTVEISKDTINGPALAGNDYYGVAVTGIGLLDADSVPDLVVGAYYDDAGGDERGAIHIHFMNADGSIKNTVEINDHTTNGPVLFDNDLYGSAIANLGLLDGDGITDLAVSAYYASGGGSHRGNVFILFMNSNGSLKSTVEINSTTPNGPSVPDGAGFGTSLAGLGTFDGDSTVDLAVGAPIAGGGGFERGIVFLIFLNNDGSVKSTVQMDSTTPNGANLIDGDRYGRAVCNMGDIDGDTITDIAVGAYKDDAGGNNRGAVHIHFMNDDGSIKSTVEINDLTTNGPALNDEDNYGNSITNLGDLDGNGVPDMAVGAHNSDIGGGDRGAIYIHYLNADGSIISTDEINSTTTNGPVLNNVDRYARGLGTLGDLDGDAIPEFVAGAYYAEVGDEGKAFIHFLAPQPTPTATPTGTPTGTLTGTPTGTPISTKTPTPSRTASPSTTPTRTPTITASPTLTMAPETPTLTQTQTKTVLPALITNTIAYPNPFNVSQQAVTIQYVLQQDADITITFYNYLGSSVKTITIAAGRTGAQGSPSGVENQVTWNGRNSRGQRLSAGGYICRIKATGQQSKHNEIATLKIALIN